VINIGVFTLESGLVLAPMAGITDQPFRTLCRQFGASLTPSEMISSNIQLWNREKCRLRRCHAGEAEPRVVQIAGADPLMMAEAARLNVEQGAQIIDINMGCPAKKVLKRSAGSALLRYPALVREILDSVIAAVDVPVTLKIRTGWDPENRNGVDIARLAQDCGISSLAVHGRTRACGFKGEAEYDTIARIKQAISIPVFANGNITSPEKAKAVLDYTGADGVMIGRGAQGRPWLFAEIRHFLEHGKPMPELPLGKISTVITSHIKAIHAFYGQDKGVFFARKHMAWYLNNIPVGDSGVENPDSHPRQLRQQFNTLQECNAQVEFLDYIFETLKTLNNKTPVKELAA